MPPRGALIALEGLDRSGKTTQTTLLLSHLPSLLPPNSPAPVLLKFPDRTTPTGHLINRFLTDPSFHLPPQTIHLLFSANRWELLSHLTSLLNSGVTVVLDRYVYSGIAFSVAKGLEYDWCKAPDVGLPRPDVVVFLDVSEEVQESRGGWGGERYEKRDIQRRVGEVFGMMGREEGMGRDEWVVVDAGRTVEEVEGEVRKAVEGAVRYAQEGGELRVFQ